MNLSDHTVRLITIMYPWKTKNWSGRNEFTETSGRLPPLWPRNKWLHTSRTADYRHTRQDIWIQTELAFTLPKNATKPNPFKIIPLQTTRKESNWKTEEAFARAAVTLETERIKGSNPWCLWWWRIPELNYTSSNIVFKRFFPFLLFQGSRGFWMHVQPKFCQRLQCVWGREPVLFWHKWFDWIAQSIAPTTFSST